MAPKRAPARRGRRSSTPASEEEAFVPTPAEKAPLQGIREETTRVETTEDDSAARDSHFTGVCAELEPTAYAQHHCLGQGLHMSCVSSMLYS